MVFSLIAQHTLNRMTMLIHLIDERNSASVKRSGIRGGPYTLRSGESTVSLSDAVFAMPVLPNFYASHQWLRELKLRGMRTIAGAYFRERADALVWVGTYNGEHRLLPLGHACGLIMREADPRGWQLVLPSSVPPKAIHAIREVPQVVGWRFFPKSHESAPWKCFCNICVASFKGIPKGRAVLRRLASDPAIAPDQADDPNLINRLRKPVRRKATTRKRREDRED